MKQNKYKLFIVLFFMVIAFTYADNFSKTESILLSFVNDFKIDPNAKEPITFVVKIKDVGDWHVIVTGQKDENNQFLVELRKGLPKDPTVMYIMDFNLLQEIDNQKINALTAMGKARASDISPMEIGFMPGFKPNELFFVKFIPFSFHFWTRGIPEIVNFSKTNSREIHGANMVIFYYQKGLRSGWGYIEKGQHVNKDPKDQVNPFPSMVIGIKGKAMAKIDGKEMMLHSGQMVFIPAGISHEAWNPFDEPAEIILLMFGDGA